MSEVLSNVSDAIHNLQSNPQFLDQQINVYTTSIYTTLQIQKKVRLLIDFLEAHQIDFKKIDMCYDLEARPRMIELLPEELKENAAEILAPVIFAGDFEYCGNFDDFMQAREMDLIYTFFKLTPPEGTSVSIRRTQVKRSKIPKSHIFYKKTPENAHFSKFLGIYQSLS